MTLIFTSCLKYIYGLNLAFYYSLSGIIFEVSHYRRIYLNPEYLFYIYETIINVTYTYFSHRTSFNYGWCPFYREQPGIHSDAISSDATPASDRSKQIRIYRGSASRKEDLGWNVSHLPRRVLLVLRPTSRATSPLLSSWIFPRDAFHFTPILRSPTFTSALNVERPSNQNLIDWILFH